MNRKILILPLMLLCAVIANGEPVVRVVHTNGSSQDYARDNVRKLVLTATSVDVVDMQNAVLQSVPLAEIARVEFTDGTPISGLADATIEKDAKVVKVIENGQVYIIADGKKYSIMGVEIENNN